LEGIQEGIPGPHMIPAEYMFRSLCYSLSTDIRI